MNIFFIIKRWVLFPTWNGIRVIGLEVYSLWCLKINKQYGCALFSCFENSNVCPLSEPTLENWSTLNWFSKVEPDNRHRHSNLQNWRAKHSHIIFPYYFLCLIVILSSNRSSPLLIKDISFINKQELQFPLH